MRKSLAVILTLLFVWNSLLGGMGELVLCLHEDGDTHLELAGNDAPAKETCCGDSETLFSEPACPPCTDLVLESVDLELVRPNMLGLVSAEMVAVSSNSYLLADSVLRPRAEVAVSHPTRGPPDVEPASELIRRVIMLRL